MTSPERYILISFIRDYLRPEFAHPREERIQRSINWERLFELARSQGLEALLHACIRDCDSEEMPVRFRQALHSEAKKAVRQHLLLTQELKRLLDHFESASILTTVLKGPPLAEQLYPEPSVRVSVDLDLYVQWCHLDRASKIACQLGYESSELPQQGGIFHDNSFHLVLHNRSNRSILELHWRILPPSHGPGEWISAALRRTVMVEWQGKAIRCLSAEDNFVYLLLHGTKHNWRELRWAVDVARLLDLNPELGLVLPSKEELPGRFRMMALSGLEAVRRKLDLTLPTPAGNLIDSHPVAEAMAEKMIARSQSVGLGPPRSPLSEVFFLSGFCENKMERWSFLMRSLFWPTTADRNWVNLSSRLFPLYFLLRPMRLFLKALGRASPEKSSETGATP